MDQHVAERDAMKISPKTKTLEIFVHLAQNKDAVWWREAWSNGSLVGFNDETPYSYGRANALGCHVQFSKSAKENSPAKLCRFLFRGVLGFDFIHAWRQRKELKKADIIWTHTESQYLAVAAVKILIGGRAKILGQSVWLFDRWGSLSFVHKSLYGFLIKRVDVLTFHSKLNLEVARKAFPMSDVRLVPFGIPDDVVIPPYLRDHGKIRVLSLGNDRHRDWSTFLEAVSNHPRISVKILSGSVPPRNVAGSQNIELSSAKNNNELKDAFAWATIMCVPLKDNLHASGITAIQEAVLSGVPVVASDTGGLRLYFSGAEVRFVSPNDSHALLTALIALGDAPEDAFEMAKAAQARFRQPPCIGASEYIRMHVEISRELLA